MTDRRRFTVLATVLLVTVFGSRGAAAQEGDEADQAVARVSFVQGSATFNRGDDPDNWQPASLNFPLASGDGFWTSRDSRAELQAGAGAIFLAPETDLTVLNLTDEVSQLSMSAGTASFRIHHLGGADSFEVAAPNAAVTFLRPGYYRVDVDASGNTRVSVFRGEASVAAAGGQVRLEAGDAIHVEGIDAPRYDVTDVARADSWDRWVDSRARRYRDLPPQQMEAAAGIVGYDDLREYGRWQEIPSYGRCWTPTVAEVGWVPYRAGSWVWRDPWGWTWVSTEPWGWAPYHYGRWVVWSSRWFWVPDPPSARVRWAPAYVGFVGGGPGWSVSVGVGGGYVGWFPLAPREPFVPWWGRRHADVDVTHVTNVTYVNRTYVTGVNQTTFVSGAPVARNVVRDREVVQRVSTAPVAQGSIPVAPTRASLHVPAKAPAAPAPARPPAPVLQRSVVSRMPPPPAPKPFASREEVARRPPSGVAPAPPAPRVAPAPPAAAEARPAAPQPRPTPQARREAVTESRPVPTIRPVEVHPPAPQPAPPVNVRPAQAEKVQLQPRGQTPQRRAVEPLKSEQPPKKMEQAPKRQEKEKEKEKPAPKKEAHPERQ